MIRERKEIESILRQSVTKGTYYYSSRKDPLRIFQALHSHTGEAVFPFIKFKDNLFPKFLRESKVDLDSAINNFIEGIRTKTENTITIGNLDLTVNARKSKSKGHKKGRSSEWDIFKNVWEQLENGPKSENPVERNMLTLMRWKSYLTLEKADKEPAPLFPLFQSSNNPDIGWWYICHVLGIPYEAYFRHEIVRGYIQSTDQYVEAKIEGFKIALEYVPILIKRFPDARKWVVDVFKESAAAYVPEWREIKAKRSNHPDYTHAFNQFIGFAVHRKSYKELGYKTTGNSTTGVFTNQHRPQGITVLLHKVHTLLYGDYEKEIRLLNDKIGKIKEVLEDVPRDTVFSRLLPKLRKEYAGPPGKNYLLPNHIASSATS